jgi:UDP-perosamine 4-acetyltransferase
MIKKIILIGGGAHSISIINLIERNYPNFKTLGYTDLKKTKLDIQYLGKDEFIFKKYNKKDILLVMSIGVDIKIRAKVFNSFKKKGYKFLTIIDKASVIASNAKIHEGSVIFPNSSVGPEAVIGKNVVLHTNSVIEHNSIVSENSYVGPSAVVCGNSKVGKNCLVGANSCIIEYIKMPHNSILGASGLLNKNYKKNKIFKGVPAK